ncbi:MAG: VOC family protein [Planctomycetota bacterium]
MSDPFVPRAGGILSADIAVPEHERELRFYARVLTTGEAPLWRDDLMNSRGMPVIGLGARTEEYADLPLQWMPHIQVADVAASAARALELGGTELMHGKDDQGNSQWAVLQDANGAAFGIIPVVPEEALSPASGDGAGDTATPTGHISWVELTVSDAPATRDFYHQVVGWSATEVEVEDESERYADYSMCTEDGSTAARIRHARGVNRGVPPVWMIHLPVRDLAESLRRVLEEEGTIVQSVTGSDGKSVSAVVQDPVGVHLALVQGE